MATKVVCATLECKWNDDGVCELKKIELQWNSVVTLWDGRQEFNRCKMYEESDDAKRIREKWEKMNGRVH